MAGELIAGGVIRITCVYDYFDPSKPGGRDVRMLPWDGRSVRSLTEEFHPPRSIDGYEIVASIDGALIDPESRSGQPGGALWDLVPPPGSSLVFALVPQGGGGSNGKNPLAMVAMLAVVVVSAIYTQYLTPGLVAAMGATEGAMAASMIQMAMVAAGGILVNAILPPGTPDDASSVSPTYGWQSSGNSETEGGTLPVLHGTHRVKPPRIGMYITTEGDKQTLNLLYAVAGHELDEISDVEINDTPAEDYNDPESETDNVIITTRLGGNDQEVIPEFLDTISQTSIVAKLSGTWTTRQTSGNTCDGMGVSIIFPAGLSYCSASGDFIDQRIRIFIEYKKVGDPEWTAWTAETITACRNTSIRRSWRKDDLVQGQYSIRLRAFSSPLDWYAWYFDIGDLVVYDDKLWRCIQEYNFGDPPAPDPLPPPQALEYWEEITDWPEIPTGRGYVNDVYWESLQEIIYDDFIYPGVSLLALKIVATDKLMGTIPTVTCLATRSNVTVWDGSADVTKPANLPAWACYDLLRNEEYGGSTDKTRLTYADFAAWATWCVSQGFTSNIYFDTSGNLRKALDTVSLLGRGVVVQRGSRFSCIVDKPEDLPVQRFLFTAGNIIRDSFSIDWLPYEGRANAIEVTYYDAEQNYSRQSVLLTSEDFETTDRPAEPATLNMVGCTDREMAIKHGTAQLKRNRYLTMMPSWTAAIDSLGCIPGDVVEVAHDRPQWGISGRIVSAASAAVTLDRAVTLEPETTYLITILHASDDSREDRYVEAVEESTTTSSLTLTQAWTAIPEKYDQYSFGEENRVTQLVRIGPITRSQQMRRRITSLEYIDAAYDDDATIGVYTPISPRVDVSDLRVEEIYKSDPGGIGYSVASLTWRGQALQWKVFYRDGGETPGPWILAGVTSYPSYEIRALITGREYDFTATSTGYIDPNQIVSLTFYGLPENPAAPESFTATLVGATIELAWTVSQDVAVKGYTVYLGELAIVTNTSGDKFTYRGPLTAGEYNFTLVCVDAYGQESEPIAATGITIEAPDTPVVSHATNSETVALSWQDCKTSLDIDYYTVNGFHVADPEYSEKVAWASKEFVVIAVDVAGNASATTTCTVTAPATGESATGAVTDIATVGRAHAIQLFLTFGTFTEFQAVEIHASATNNFAAAAYVGETTSSVFSHTGLDLIATRYYWTRIRKKDLTYGAWYPLSTNAGASGTTSTDPGAYLGPILTDESGLTQTLRDRIAWIDQGGFLFGGDYVTPDTVIGMNGVFNTLAALGTDHDTRISSAEIQIDEGIAGEWASITSKVTTIAYDADQKVGGVLRISTAEQNITAGKAGEWAGIQSKVSTIRYEGDQYTEGVLRISTAESDILAGKAGEWAGIIDKVLTSRYDADQIDPETSTLRISLAENDLLAGKAGTWASFDTKLAVATYNTDTKDDNGFSRITALENRFDVYDTTDADTWASGVTYDPGTIVIRSGLCYRCKKVALNIEPEVTDGWSLYWFKIEAGMLSRWTLKVQANGYVAGVGLSIDGSGASAFVIESDNFYIMKPGFEGPATAVFGVDAVTGDVGIDGNLIISGSLLADKIGAGTITSKTITLAYQSGSGNAQICAGKTDFSNDAMYGAGFCFGIHHADGLAKLYMGNDTQYINWTGTTLVVGGDIITTGNIKTQNITSPLIKDYAVSQTWFGTATGVCSSGEITWLGGNVHITVTSGALALENRTFTLKRDGTTIYTDSMWAYIYAVTFVDQDVTAGAHTYTAELSGSTNELNMAILDIIK